MSQTPATSRTLGGADEFERRMRMMGQPAASDDPLAELARLVGQEDPFRGVFPQKSVTSARAKAETARIPEAPQEPAAPARNDVASQPYAGLHGASDDDAAFERDLRPPFDPGEEPGAPDDPAVVHAPVDAVAARRSSEARFYPAVSIDGRAATTPTPDEWAQGPGPIAAERDDNGLSATRESAGSTAGSSRRTMTVLAAVIVLTGGGLAASFLARAPASGFTAAASAPTILAAAGPSKVQPEKTASDPDAPSEPSTLLDKNKNDGTASAKVVSSTEQPVDLNQVVKSAQTAAADEPRPSTAGSFPEPRKVKTVMVRPDGSIISVSTAGKPSAPAPDDVASLEFNTKMAIPAVAPPVAASPQDPAAPAPATGRSSSAKVTARAATTPKPVSQDSEAAAPGSDATTTQTPAASKPKARQAAAPTPTRTPVKPKPTDVASAETPTTASVPAATPGAGGGYAVQIGAPPTEQEARDASTRFQKKFAEQLGAYRPSIHKADTGDKSVYRIRVGNLSQEDAKALCSKLQAGGGGCFVVRN